MSRIRTSAHWVPTAVNVTVRVTAQMAVTCSAAPEVSTQRSRSSRRGVTANSTGAASSNVTSVSEKWRRTSAYEMAVQTFPI